MSVHKATKGSQVSTGQAWHGRTDSVKQTEALGAVVAKHARAGDVIALIGELGTGKTQFVRGVATVLADDAAAVASPTFVMIHEYAARGEGPVLVHIDAYRLDRLEDLESIGCLPDAEHGFGDELLQDAVLVIEWADRLGGMLGDNALEVRLAHETEQTRLCEIRPGGSWSNRWPKLRHALIGATNVDATHRQVPRPCPICDKLVPQNSESVPFCSDRCRSIDLARWIDGKYVISREIEQSDLET